MEKNTNRPLTSRAPTPIRVGIAMVVFVIAIPFGVSIVLGQAVKACVRGLINTITGLSCYVRTGEFR